MTEITGTGQRIFDNPTSNAFTCTSKKIICVLSTICFIAICIFRYREALSLPDLAGSSSDTSTVLDRYPIEYGKEDETLVSFIDTTSDDKKPDGPAIFSNDDENPVSFVSDVDKGDDVEEAEDSEVVEDVEDVVIGSQTAKSNLELASGVAKSEWKSPRIVILAGPHKTGSTSLQVFISDLFGMTIATGNVTDTSKFITPHPNVDEWVWPVGVREEYYGEYNLDEVRFREEDITKFYKNLVPFMLKSDRMNETKNQEISNYFRSLFRIPWEQGRNIVIGAEALDWLIGSLAKNVQKRGLGEATYVEETSKNKIHRLLNLFPLNSDIRTPPLRLNDIEVNINFRTPRVAHMASLWHEISGGSQKRTMQEFIKSMIHIHFHTINPLVQALQWTRAGVRTTILDMAGIKEKEAREFHANETSGNDVNDDGVIFDGMQGIVACDILQLGKKNGTSNLCDNHSRLHLSNLSKNKLSIKSVINKKGDPNIRNLTDKELEHMERALNDYDCSVWKHLQKYEETGKLRFLYKSKDLFATCNGKQSKDISTYDVAEKLLRIAIGTGQ